MQAKCALFWPHISIFFPLSPPFFHGYARVMPALLVAPNFPFFSEHVMFVRNCALNWGRKALSLSDSSMYTAFGAVQVFLNLVFSVLAQHFNLILAQNRALCDLLCEKVIELRSQCAFLPYVCEYY